MQAQKIIFLAHFSVRSHLSIKRTTEQVLKSGYRWENRNVTYQRWPLSVKYVEQEDQSQEKNIATKHIESHRTKERYQADAVFLSDYLVGNTCQRYLLTNVNHFIKFGYATLMHTNTGIKVLAFLKNS